MAYCVRIRFCMAERLQIDSPEVEVAIPDPRNGKDVTLRSIEADTPIAEAKHLALIVKSYPSEDEALAAGEWWAFWERRSLASGSASTSVSAAAHRQ